MVRGARRQTGVLAIMLLGSGCYAWHGGDPRERDGGITSDTDPITPDTGVADAIAPDTTPLPDASPRVDAQGGGPLVPPPRPEPRGCRVEPTVHPFDEPVLEYRWPTGPVTHVDSVHVSMTPLVIDLDPREGPIEPVLVFVSYPPLQTREEPPGTLRIVDPRTDTTVSWPPHDGELGVLEATTNLAAGDLDGDGRNEIVGLGIYSGTYAFRGDGTLLWESVHPTEAERGLLRARSISGAPALADLEGDGTVEVVVGRNVLDGATGMLRWRGQGETGRARNQFLGPISCVADLDGDGNQEVVAGHTAFRADGSILWNNADAPDGLCAVADVLTESTGPEVVLSAHGYVRILAGSTGEQLWLRQLEGRVRISVGGAPTVADFDGDGDVEIGIAHGGAYGVYDPDCRGLGAPEGCTDSGLLWKQFTSDASSSGTGSSVFDFNGDGRAEVVYNDEFHFRIYDGTSGQELFEHPNSSRTRTENPTIADVDNDGDAEIVFSANAEARFLRREFWTDPGVEVWGDRRGRWVGARRIWNQHAYHITNVEEDGTIGSPEEPSWTVLNAYRQNLREGGDVLATPDLWGGEGRFDCAGRGRANLSVEVANWGLERVGAGVVVRFYRGPPSGGDLVGQTETTRPLEAGGDAQIVSIAVELDGTATDYWAVLDDPADPDGGRVAECREGNNHVLIRAPTCP